METIKQKVLTILHRISEGEDTYNVILQALKEQDAESRADERKRCVARVDRWLNEVESYGDEPDMNDIANVIMAGGVG